MYNKTKVKRINVYLTYEERKKLTDLKNKYHVSFSTIADKIAEIYWIGTTTTFREKYLYQEKGIKTSIKPKFSNFENNVIDQSSTLSIYYTNVIKTFLNKDFSKWTGKDIKEQQKRESQVHNLLKNTWDENWDGNDFCKKFPRFIKANPKYTKKLLGIEGDE